MTTDFDLILIAQSEVVDYRGYSHLPLDRIEVYRELVYPRMVYHGGAFRSHIDLLNIVGNGVSFVDATAEQRRSLLSVWNLPSLGGLHLANYLHAQGFRVCVINNFDAESDRFREVYANCQAPPLVGISTTFHLGWAEIRRLSGQLRNLDPGMAIVVGGAFANALTHTQELSAFEAPMRKYRIDYLIHGFHAEPDLANLLRARRGEFDLAATANLVYFDTDDHFQATAQQWNPPLLDDQPACFDRICAPFINRTVQARTSSGCAFSCAFCSYPRVARGYHPMSLDAVDRSLASIKRIPGVRSVVFVDDTFNIPRERFRGICDLLARHQLDWYSFLRVQFINEDDAKRMRDSGCQAVYLGIESANDQVLENMNKKATRAEFTRGVNLLRKQGIVSMAAFVLGFPGETKKSIDDDLQFIEQTGVEFYTLKPFYYMAHTGVHEQREQYQLTGMGNQWSHSTMDAVTVQRHLMRLFREIKGSCYLDADTSLWHIALMCDAGFSLAEIERLQRETNEIVRRQLDGQFDDADPGFARLKAILDHRDVHHD